MYANALNLPIITSGICSESYGDLGKKPYYENVPVDGETEMMEEVCKNTADDHDELTWAVFPEASADSAPYGCYLDADMKTLTWNANEGSNVKCTPEMPCLCGSSNDYCDPKKYYVSSPIERWLGKGYGQNFTVPVIAYAPNTPEVTTIVESYLMEQMVANGVHPFAVRMQGYDTEKEFEDIHVLTQMAAAIVFKTGSADDSLLGLSPTMSQVHYTLRMAADLPSLYSWLTPAMYQNGIGTKPEPDDSNPYTDGDSRNGFLFLQAGVERALARHFHPTKMPPAAYARLKSFPYPQFEEYGFISFSSGIVIFFVGVISIMIVISNLITDIVTEKKERHREYMKMMGATQMDIWLSWIIKWLLQLLLVSVLVTFVLNGGKNAPIKFSSGFLFWLLFYSYCIACMSFGCFITTLFQEPTVASIAGTILLYLTYIPYNQLQTPSNWDTGERPLDTLSQGAKLGMCLMPMSAFGMSMDIIGRYEIKGLGATFENAGSGPNENEDFGIGHAIVMLWLSTLIFAVLTWYCDNVIQGEFGTAKSWFFFLDFKAADKLNDARVYESDTVVDADKAIGIQIDHLVKKWPSPDGAKIAVDDLNLNVQKDEITVLLGHNGAGKTTAMSIMCGMYPPSAGTVLINGHNVSTNMNDARESLGLCPQFDIIWKNLSVRKHLELYCRLKGVTDERYIENEIQTFLKDLDLQDKENEKAGTLSGGQKRCLSCSIAFIAGSKTVILDEPTSGMDPEKRRLTWKLIAKHREGKTILLTTHFMDEADLLGDRIAIMHHGKLAAAGSSVQLKKEYGSGYKLTVTKGSKYNDNAVLTVVNASVNGATLVPNSLDTEICFNLPNAEISKFPDLFEALEAEKQKLGLESFGISCTTMEEVFLRVGDDGLPEGHETEGLDDNEFLLGNARVTEDGIGIDSEKEIGCALWMQQFRALFYKRYINAKRSLIGTLLGVGIPVILILIGLLVAKFVPESEFEKVIASCRTIAFADTNPDQVVYLSGHDTKYDKFADVSPIVEADFARVAAMGSEVPNSLDSQTALFARAKTFVDDKKIAKADFTDKDFSAELLKAFDSFTTTRRLDKDKVGLTVDQGVTWITEPGTGCEYSAYPEYSGAGTPKVSTPFGNNKVHLVPDVWYTFAFDKSLNPDLDSSDNSKTATLSNADGTELWSTAIAYRQARVVDKTAVPEGVDVLGRMSFPYANMTAFIDTQRQIITGNKDTENAFEAALFDVIAAEANKFTGPSSRAPVLRLKFDATGDETLTLKCPNGAAIAISAYTNSTSETPFAPPSSAVFAWRTPNMVHSSAESLNFAGNVIAKDHLDTDDVEFILQNCPLPKSIAQQSQSIAVSGSIIQVIILLIFGMSGYVSVLVLFPFGERKSHAKHIQFVSGANDFVYWASSFVWDFMLGIVTVLLATICVAAVNLDTLNDELIGYYLLVLLMTLWSTIPLLYIAATVLPVDSKAVAFSLCFFFFFMGNVISFFVIVFVGLFSESELTKERIDKADIGLMINPVYAMCKAVYTMANNKQQLGIVNRIEASGFSLDSLGIDLDYQTNYLAWGKGGIGKHLAFLAIDGVVYLFLLFYIEWASRRQGKTKASADVELQGDHDVMEERQRIIGGGNNDDVVVSGISKRYGGGLTPTSDCSGIERRRGCAKNELMACATFNFSRCVEHKEANVAVESLTFGIPKKTCFGLLGVNGAGKTTTFEMLTGEKTLSTGTVKIKGMDIATQMKAIRQHIGYCPQYDGLIGTLTGRESLAMFARLRGVPESKVEGIVSGAIEALSLTMFADQQCGTYSGGNKRKLSTAIAIVGAPDIIFLDEPTSGMDPKSRRYLWNVLLAIKQSGKIIILTSHSMEECEALCSKVVIMKSGQLQCMGSPQHLKEKYGSGYTITARLQRQENGRPADTTELKRMFDTKFPNANFEKDVYGEVSYTVGNQTHLSTLFRTLESVKVGLRIEDYSVAQTSLEQVFLKIAEEGSERPTSQTNPAVVSQPYGGVNTSHGTSQIVKQTPV